MKKYIITEPELKTLIWQMTNGDYDYIGANILYVLKPIEPLSNGDIHLVYLTAANQTLRSQDERIAFAFAREIEAHITGSGK